MKLEGWICDKCGMVIYIGEGLEMDESACILYWDRDCMGDLEKTGKTITIPHDGEEEK